MTDLKPTYDVIVVGSGAAGSFAAMALTGSGLDVLLLEAGRAITPEDFPTNGKGPREKGIQLWARFRAALSGQPLQSRVALYSQHQRHLFVNDREHPYTTPSDKPYLWIRGKQLGGRLHTYGRVLMRWSDTDFKAASRDGYGENWPISYADIEPYYSKVESCLGIRGCADGIAHLPDGVYSGPSKLTSAERAFKDAIEGRWEDRNAISWRYMPPNIKRTPQPLQAALASGKLDIRSDAVVRRIVTDPTSGLANGVEFVDRQTKEVHKANCRTVFVGASAIETVRLLLNSISDKHPAGLGNSSGNLGRYFMDQVPSMIMGTVPGHFGWEADDTVAPDPFYGVTGGIYIPRFSNLRDQGENGFIRGFGYQGTIGRLYSRDDQPAKFAIMGFGEMLAQVDNRITLSARRVDQWGMPIPHIACGMGDNERALLARQVEEIREMAAAAGLDTEFAGSYLGLAEEGRGAFPEADWFSRMLFRMNFRKSMAMGAAIHESGGARMGDDPTKSVLNPHNQLWDAPNVFVTDASSFVTSGCSGTTLTLMALSLRAGEYAAKAMASGEL